MQPQTGVRSGVLLAVLGLWVILRSTHGDVNKRTLINHILGTGPDDKPWQGPSASTATSTAAGSSAAASTANSIANPVPSSSGVVGETAQQGQLAQTRVNRQPLNPAMAAIADHILAGERRAGFHRTPSRGPNMLHHP